MMHNTKKTALTLAMACAALYGCTVYQPAPPARVGPTPYQVSLQRKAQIEHRIATQHHRIDARVSQGYIDPGYGGALHRRVDAIQRELNDMASQQGGGISGEEQRVLNEQLDGNSRRIGR